MAGIFYRGGIQKSLELKKFLPGGGFPTKENNMELNECKKCGGDARVESKLAENISTGSIKGEIYICVCQNCRACTPTYFTAMYAAKEEWNSRNSQVENIEQKTTEIKDISRDICSMIEEQDNSDIKKLMIVLAVETMKLLKKSVAGVGE